MVKLIAVYGPSGSPSEFERQYRERHLPLAMRIPGVRKCELAWTYAALAGEPRYRLVAELYFDDRAALDAALESPEAAATAADAAKLAGDGFHVTFAEVEVHHATMSPAPKNRAE